MDKMLLKFSILIEDRNYPAIERRWGAVFNRWLPNGIEDALEIDCEDYTKIKLWFQGLKRVKDGVPFPRTPEEILGEPDLDGGMLFGKLEVNNFTEGEREAVIKNKVGAADYVRLGKRLVTKTIYPYVGKLLNILRVTYGQYWIPPLSKWDSRESSLGYYCKDMSMKWSLDGGESWNDFLPNPSTVNIAASIVGRIGNENQYIKREDWDNIQSLLRTDYTPSLGSLMLSQAHKRKDQEDIKFALIEAVTALEIAMEERLSENIKTDKTLVEYTDNFWKLSMPAKLTIISSLIGGITTQELQDSIKAIHLRNELAHEAKEILDDDETIELVENLISTISKILITPVLKFPQMNLIE
ncbi:hypothetical protein ACSS31_28460 (plasmid) [Priestia megaterium]